MVEGEVCFTRLDALPSNAGIVASDDERLAFPPPDLARVLAQPDRGVPAPSLRERSMAQLPPWGFFPFQTTPLQEQNESAAQKLRAALHLEASGSPVAEAPRPTSPPPFLRITFLGTGCAEPSKAGS